MDEIRLNSVDHFASIRKAYEEHTSDLRELFRTVLLVAEEVGLDTALKHLEKCVIERRTRWIRKSRGLLPRSRSPLDDAYRAFYEMYLQISVPHDGEIVDRSGTKLVMRWWNDCPVLNACVEFGLDTREVCKKAYHRPTQVFMSSLDEGLSFDRNYNCIRPFAPYCEEIIIWNDTVTSVRQ